MPNTPQSATFASLSPSIWAADGYTSIWVVCYHALRMPPSAMSALPLLVDLASNVRVVLIRAQVKYLDAGALNLDPQGDGLHLSANPEERTTVDGTYCLVMVPFDRGETNGAEVATRGVCAEVAALIAAVLGQNVVLDRVFENIFSLDDTMATAMTAGVLNPLRLPEPQLDDQSRMDLVAGYGVLGGELGDEVRLSLRWYDQGIRASGLDAFIKLWVAIEALAMTNTDIRPVNERLAHLYGITYEEARARFEVGRLYGFRGEVVHRAAQRPVHASLSQYLQALYIDLLRDALRLPPRRHLEGVRATGFSVKGVLNPEHTWTPQDENVSPLHWIRAVVTNRVSQPTPTELRPTE